MKNLTKRSAFTLIELLVVIAIIGILMSLAGVGLSGARAAARRTQCMNNMRNIGQSMLVFHTNKDQLPFFIDKNGRGWAEQLLPLVEEQQRHKLILKSAPTQAELNDSAYASLPLFVCPVDFDPTDGGTGFPQLSYVVNAGTYDPNYATAVPTKDCATGYGLIKQPLDRGVKMDSIKDGASNTILLTENLQADTWRLCWTNAAAPAANAPRRSDTATYTTDAAFYTDYNDWMHTKTGNTFSGIGSAGFRWTNNTTVTTDQLPVVNPVIATPPTGVTRFNYARPSSSHPGVIVTLYADGSVRPLDEDITVGEYTKACNPDDAKNTGSFAWQ